MCARQTALLLVLEPIFEADLLGEQYAYRSQRSAHDAVEAVVQLVRAGYREVVDADLSGYFDNISHQWLMKFLERPTCGRCPSPIPGCCGS